MHTRTRARRNANARVHTHNIQFMKNLILLLYSFISSERAYSLKIPLCCQGFVSDIVCGATVGKIGIKIQDSFGFVFFFIFCDMYSRLQ